MNIVLTGFMGTGKTVVGRLLAQALGWQFFDTDAMIEEETGMSIADIFARQGEPQFRALETQTIRLLGLLDGAVISCGGGAVLKPENMTELEKKGLIICLTAAPETIVERTKHKRHRPLLNEKDPPARIRELLAAREACYRRAHLSIATDGKSPKEIVKEVLSNPSVASRLGK
jgi:shikimate kinase